MGEEMARTMHLHAGRGKEKSEQSLCRHFFPFLSFRSCTHTEPRAGVLAMERRGEERIYSNADGYGDGSQRLGGSSSTISIANSMDMIA